ncbi:hypothetical protein [Dentiradicibacter hellwigii]|uniref:Uncharacterized protein n=1 Tax=Dentiradicibacter hellwigii TaxID=3149053 RepID=A0ABV4UE45_9RHOO
MSNIKLTGSQKQIAWAQDLREKAAANIAVITAEIDKYLQREYDDEPEMMEEIRQAVREYLQAFMDEARASEWIDRKSSYLCFSQGGHGIVAGTPLAENAGLNILNQARHAYRK